jgi:hypothetical protein
MFVDAIEIAAAFTRPIYFVTRHFGSTELVPGAATLFLVNPDGWALTCGHVAREIMAIEGLPARVKPFKDALKAVPGKLSPHRHEKAVVKQFKMTSDHALDAKCSFMDCVDAMTHFDIKLHSSLDIALIHFVGFKTLQCSTFPRFPKDTSSLKQGRFLCRLGFPFPEFSNFQLDSATDTIQWTPSGKSATPRFPIEGMVTRHLAAQDSSVVGFELSTPGLRGQSGGPAFDVTGQVWGMQSATNHLDLNFDVDQKVRRAGHMKAVQDSAFLHVGHCVHVDALKAFMRTNNVTFTEVSA